MINPANTPRNKNKADPDTPQSASINTTSTSDGTTITLDSAPAVASSIPGLYPPQETGEEEEEEEIDQEGLPEDIKENTYLGEEGEVQLIKDLEKHDLADNRIDLSHGKAHWREIATDFHQSAIKEIEDYVKTSEGHKDRLYVDAILSNVKVGNQGNKKEPDLLVWGKSRLKACKGGRVRPITMQVAGSNARRRMNPHVVFEFSWSNKLKTKEIPKFRRQMDEHDGALGAIELGFLIKAIPVSGTKLPPEDNPSSIPVCGFDVYEARPGNGKGVKAGHPNHKYCVDEMEDTFITISGSDLGDGDYANIDIPLQKIRDVLDEDLGVVFQRQTKPED
ncbi:hypothetical protein SEMRO_280_G107010.1 [Seminavis robusta]|uniref:Uncharacterized protein n=1 Tax=Seminavis robusta TaxID=568900 RepID=A0A9N8HBK1_9STRA|nr:hypothetical protein SEMRO_280_G107010.1 [Seminavis robusta]|eukprot:Sro280_g107010.1 n/a (335) ;mRNA; f:26709-27974